MVIRNYVHRKNVAVPTKLALGLVLAFANFHLIVQVGDRKDSDVYIRQKRKAAADIGINADLLKLPK